ncbi:PepSY domain-containing protein [Salmonella enterica]|nr:PepSY domain-containing protein [Salmonella enterica]
MKPDASLFRSLTARNVTALLTILLAAMLWPAGGRAEGGCLPHPPSQQIPETKMRQMLEENGYRIHELKITNNCYEMKGETQEGDRVQLWLDTLTADVVRSDTVEPISP